jgi:hypothetical protein
MSAPPVIGYVNYLSRDEVVLDCTTLAADADIDNLISPNLAATTDLGLGAAVDLTIDFGAALADTPTLLYIRFRGTGWQDLVSVRVRTSANSNLSSPDIDQTINTQFPAVWPDRIPVRPIFVAVFADTFTGRRYAGLTFTRTTGSEPLEVAYVYFGESISLTGGAGYEVHVSSNFSVEDHSTTVLGDLQTDLQTAGGKRRVFPIKIIAKTFSHVLDEWYPKLMFAGAARPTVYVRDPEETDDLRVQMYNILGTVVIGATIDISAVEGGWWEQQLIIRERL